MAKYKTYTNVWNQTIAPGASVHLEQHIENNFRPLNICGIYFDWRAREHGSGITIPFDNNISQMISLQVRNLVPAGLISEPYTNDTALSAVNGMLVQITTPGQYFFKNLFLYNAVQIFFDQLNGDILNSIDFWTSVIIDTEVNE